MSKQVSNFDGISTSNPYNKVYNSFKSYATTAAEKSANELFKDKPFSLEYRPLYLASKLLKVVANVVSCLTLFYALYAAIAPTIGSAPAIGISCTICLILEYIKNYLWRIGSKQAQKYNTYSTLLISALLGLHLISLIGSAFGAYKLPESLPEQPTPAAVLFNVDSIQRAYNAKLGMIDKQLLILASNTRSHAVKAAANLTNQKRTIQAEQSSLTAIYRAKNDSISQSHQNTILSAQNANKAYILNMQYTAVGACVFFELLYILAAFFIAYYLFRMYVEATAGKAAIKPTVSAVKDSTTANVTSAIKEPSQLPEKAPAATERVTIKGFEQVRKQGEIEGKKMDYTRVCEHTPCSNKFIHKVHNQKYCSTKCRIAAWESKAGKRLIK